MNDYWYRSTSGDPPKREPKDDAMTGEGYPITDNAAWLMKWMARHGFALTLAALAELAHRMDELSDLVKDLETELDNWKEQRE